MESFFRRRPMNPLFPFCVAGGAVVLGWMVLVAQRPETTAADVLGLTLAGTMLALAILEHAMLVLPVSTSALWRWAMGQRQQRGHRARGQADPRTTGDTPNALRADAALPALDHDDKLLHAR
jgi:hypothetical protein